MKLLTMILVLVSLSNIGCASLKSKLCETDEASIEAPRDPNEPTFWQKLGRSMSGFQVGTPAQPQPQYVAPVQCTQQVAGNLIFTNCR